jgi:putative lipoprotein
MPTSIAARTQAGGARPLVVHCSAMHRAWFVPGLRIALLTFTASVTASPTARAQDADPWLSRDKALHFDVSAGIAAAAYGVSAGWIAPDARWTALAIGGGVALAAGVGKELVDATHVFGGDPSWKDLTWDVIGTVAGLAIAWGMDLLLGGVSAQRPLLAAP